MIRSASIQLRFGNIVLFRYRNAQVICAKSLSMADEAFALSPISARAVLPGEEDYAAIAEAFMETSRGRWFLTEYAKRNRNADTRMVLDAVARIEQSLAAQREEGLATQSSRRKANRAETNLTEALAAIRSAVEAAQASAIGGARRPGAGAKAGAASARARG